MDIQKCDCYSGEQSYIDIQKSIYGIIMKILTLSSRKGGAGKSTLARAFAVEAAAGGCRVLLLDMDPQATVMEWGGRRKASAPTIRAATPATIRQEIENARRDGNRLVVIDTPPHTDVAVSEAARLSDAILIPIRPSPDDIGAARHTIAIARDMGRPAVLIVNAAPTRAATAAMAREALAPFGLPVVPHDVVDRIAHAYASAAGMTAGEYEPGGKAAREIAAAWAFINATLKLDIQKSI